MIRVWWFQAWKHALCFGSVLVVLLTTVALAPGPAASSSQRYDVTTFTYDEPVGVSQAASSRPPGAVASVAGPAGSVLRTLGHVSDESSSFVAPNTTPRAPDFVAGPVGSGPPVPVSQSRMAARFDAAGFRGLQRPRPAWSTHSQTDHSFDSCNPLGTHRCELRSPTRRVARSIRSPGNLVQPPAPSGWSMKDWVRALTHVEQTP